MRATTIEGQNVLLQRCALREFHVTDSKTSVTRLRVIEGSNALDQIAFCTFHTFVVEVQTNAGYIYLYMRRMRNNNLEIRISCSSCQPQ